MLKIIKNTIQSYKRRKAIRKARKAIPEITEVRLKATDQFGNETILSKEEVLEIKPVKPKLYNIEVHYEYEIQTFEATSYTVYDKHITMELEGNKTIILPYKKLFIEEIIMQESDKKSS